MQVLRCALPLFLGLLLTPSEAASPVAALEVNPAEISVGQSVDLSWTVPANAAAFLAPKGIITGPSSGTIRLKPSSSLDYVLIIESKDQSPAFISRHVRISGAKASENEWHLIEPLAARIEYELNGTNLVRYAQHVLKVLQDDDHFDAREIQLEGRYVVGTKFSQAFIPVDTEEHPRKLRRIAYRVSLGIIDGKLHVEITSEIDWRIPILEMWNLEAADSKLCRRALSDLKVALTIDQKKE
jgi:hypothetical protein